MTEKVKATKHNIVCTTIVYTMYPDDPLDKQWTDDGVFGKEPKPITLNGVGDGKEKYTKVFRPIRIRGTEEIIDLATKRLNERTRLLNYKANMIERGLYDYISQNEVERAYQKQLAEMARLEAIFQQGLLGFLFDNVKDKAVNKFRSDFLQNDPDVVNFDRSTETLAQATQTVAEQQEANDNTLDEVRVGVNNLEADLIARMQTAPTIDEIGEFEELVGELEILKKDFDEIQEVVSAPRVFQADLDDESVIRRAEADEATLADRLANTRERLNEISSRVEGRGIKAQLARLNKNLATIASYSEQQATPIRHGRAIENIIREAELGEVKDRRTVAQRNQRLEKYIEELREQFGGGSST